VCTAFLHLVPALFYWTLKQVNPPLNLFFLVTTIRIFTIANMDADIDDDMSPEFSENEKHILELFDKLQSLQMELAIEKTRLVHASRDEGDFSQISTC
jgi:hypothetical protein